MPLRKSDGLLETTTSLPLLDVAPEIAICDASPTTRRRAARLLATDPNGSALLGAALAQETDPSVRDSIIGSLVRCADDAAVTALTTALRSEDAGLRNAAVEALGQLRSHSAPMLRRMLDDGDVDVRILTVNALNEFERGADVEIWLIGVLERDADVNVCAAALTALCDIGSPAALPAIAAVEARFASEPYLQFAAELAHRRIVDAAGVS